MSNKASEISLVPASRNFAEAVAHEQALNAASERGIKGPSTAEEIHAFCEELNKQPKFDILMPIS